MISTGISSLDEMLGGGIPRGSRVLYSMESGANGQLFLVSTFLSALSENLACLVLLPNTTVDAFLQDAEAVHGSSIDMAKQTVVFMDAVDRERIQRAGRTAGAREKEWQTRIRKVCGERGIDVIFAYFDLLYEDCGLKKGLSLLQTLTGDKNPTIILEHLNLEGPALLDRFVREFSFDLIIAIRSSFPPFPQFSTFTIAHVSWGKVPKRSIPFMISEGEIVPYIPRIVITGPAGSGKSTFVTSASDEGYSIDRRGTGGDTTTVAMDFGYLRHNDFGITLYGTPGQSRFDPLIAPLLGHAMGVVVVIDATRPETFGRARDLIGLVAKKRVPVVIAANRHDLPGAAGEEVIRRTLGIPDEIPVFMVSARKRADVHRVLESMVDHITQFSY
ncbi:MAG: ADP-ribosylation factor-like protein [Methanoregula sp.]|nr:ADP-ribosylation factor-like protein [Methanoregula sp.]